MIATVNVAKAKPFNILAMYRYVIIMVLDHFSVASSLDSGELADVCGIPNFEAEVIEMIGIDRIRGRLGSDRLRGPPK
jgi:hypothetical protein